MCCIMDLQPPYSAQKWLEDAEFFLEVEFLGKCFLSHDAPKLHGPWLSPPSRASLGRLPIRVVGTKVSEGFLKGPRTRLC